MALWGSSTDRNAAAYIDPASESRSERALRLKTVATNGIASTDTGKETKSSGVDVPA